MDVAQLVSFYTGGFRVAFLLKEFHRIHNGWKIQLCAFLRVNIDL